MLARSAFLSGLSRLERQRLFLMEDADTRGRPHIPAELQRLIAQMAAANCTWGEERIAAEVSLKLGLTVSVRTIPSLCPDALRRAAVRRRWSTFLRTHAG
jgi:putative transposase